LRFGIGFSQGLAFAGIEIKEMSAIYPSQNNLEQIKRKNSEKQGLQQKRLIKQKMPQQSKKCLRSTGGAADPPRRFFLPFGFSRYKTKTCGKYGKLLFTCQESIEPIHVYTNIDSILHESMAICVLDQRDQRWVNMLK
jgi:hypothetical protein